MAFKVKYVLGLSLATQKGLEYEEKKTKDYDRHQSDAPPPTLVWPRLTIQWFFKASLRIVFNIKVG